ncbi:glycoside hydrolase family 2 TIM barrel-domain containing protein [Bacteroides sp. 51]|uniref:glycoside hydrolase family 2 TIM barrel-domain containing protein n=1 Tax=Bacteroides sp. 51 TaxID=2302938 RepID=UPI0013D4DC59|nr:glycoside hydrolase family 2 TIM barrel-domain containing protein [Bacteroides sp. 51]NDV81587.1 DUF4981 domain-containing protein [Bacteroides sp. 51]
MKTIVLNLLLFCIAVSLQAQTTPPWEDPNIIGINKESYHSTLMLPSQKKNCPEIISLDGKWRFHWSPDPQSRPAEFYNVGFDASHWDEIVVPGTWQMQGYGIPIYTNWTHPFKKDQPRVMGEPPANYFSYKNRNPVGSYLTTFEVSPQMKGKQLYLHFEGVKSAMYLWINGRQVGYSENSMAPAEFDVTEYVKEGQNQLAVEVYRWSDGSYLEDQDMWRTSGIYRSVELWVRPQTHIQDYKLATLLSDDFSSAQFNASVNVRNKSAKKTRNLTVEVVLTGESTQGEKLEEKLTGKLNSLGTLSTETVSLTGTLRNPRLWSSEKPYLYDVSITLRDKNGVVDAFRYHWGVRKIEVDGEVFKINGKPVKIKGVNRHEFHPRMGISIDEATLIKDLQLMKQANINMIRTSHYPDQPIFYELCDRFGLYVMDEANQESHDYGMGNKELGDNPVWTKAHVDRALSLVERDKNHPSIVFWSLGNEGGKGMNLKAMSDTILAIDPTRLIYSDSDDSVSAIRDEGYPHPDNLRKLAEKNTDRPLFMREYAHAMGNSLGNFKEYWDIIEADESIVGGAIWEWADHGIAKPIDGSPLKYDANPALLRLKDGEFFAYGGDFGDQPNAGAFCIDGVIGADRVPNPHYYEIQKVHQYIAFALRDKGTIDLTNKHFFTSLDEFDYTYEWVQDGQVTQIGTLSLASGGTLRVPPAPQGGEVCLNVYARLKHKTLWANKGFAVAREQFLLNEMKPEPLRTEGGKVMIKQQNTTLAISASAQTFLINTQSGALESWKRNGNELLQAALEPYFWKPANDNQRRNGYNKRLGAWKNAANNRIVKEVKTDVSKEGLAVVEIAMTLPEIGAEYLLKYTVNGNGRIQVEASYQPTAENIPLMPKFGMRMRLPADMNRVEWYGRGEFENYPDRKTAAFLGHYTLPLNEFITNYTVPQDNANRCDVRWFSLDSASGTGIKVTGLQPLCFRAWPYMEEDLETSGHPYQIPQRDFVNVNIDLNIHGVGGDDAWGARTMDKYTIDGNKPYRYGFVMEEYSF